MEVLSVFLSSSEDVNALDLVACSVYVEGIVCSNKYGQKSFSLCIVVSWEDQLKTQSITFINILSYKAAFPTTS